MNPNSGERACRGSDNCQAKLKPAPEALVTDGRFNLGTYCAPFPRVNPLDADLRCGIRLPRWAKNLTLKEWEHFALANSRFYVSVVIFNAKRLALTHVVVYDRESGEKTVYERRVRPQAVVVPSGLWDAHARVVTPGYALEIHNHLAESAHRISFECDSAGGLPTVRGAFVCHEDPAQHEPLVVCMPFRNGRAMYSHKGVFPLEGELCIGGDTYAFEPGDSYAMPDIHKGFYPYVMKWHWTTGGGWNSAGQLIGLNLTNNQVEDQATYNENALWVDGKVHLLPPVTFSMKPGNLDKPWRVRDDEGRVDIEFRPEVTRNIDINVLVLRSRYRGPYGRFSGRIVDSQGESVDIGHCYGMAEDFYLRA